MTVSTKDDERKPDADRETMQPQHASAPALTPEMPEPMAGALAGPDGMGLAAAPGDPIDSHARFLGDPRWRGAANAVRRAQFVTGLQQQHGNAYVRRVVQRAATISQADEEDHLAERIRAASSGGNSLDASARRELEYGLNADLSGVKVHTDDEADRLARAVDAVAFTTGQHIFFRAGEYNPASQKGVHLLAHEAAHAEQQAQVAARPMQSSLRMSSPLDSAEKEAAGAASAVARGAYFSGPLTPSPLQIMRQAVGVVSKEELETAAKMAAEEELIPEPVLKMSNVSDVESARRTLADIEAATPTLIEAMKTKRIVGVTPITMPHVEANEAAAVAMRNYLAQAGEEMRTSGDFRHRYQKARRQFARLSGMVDQYNAFSLTDVEEAPALVMAETGLSPEAAGRRFAGLPKATALGGETALEAKKHQVRESRSSIARLKREMNGANRKAGQAKLQALSISGSLQAAVAQTKAEELKGEADSLKQEVKEVQNIVSWGAGKIVTAVEAGSAGGPAAGAAAVGKEIAKEAGEKTLGAAFETAVSAIYAEELAKATEAESKAKALTTRAEKLGHSATALNLAKAASEWKGALEKQLALSRGFDTEQENLRKVLRELGEAAEAMVGVKEGKEQQGGYAILAMFFAEAEIYINEVEVAIAMGKLQLEAGSRADSERKTAITGESAEYGKPGSVWGGGRAYHRAKKIGLDFWLREDVHIHLVSAGRGSAGGEGGMTETVELMIKDLEADRKLVKKYHADLSKVFAGL